MELTLAEQIGLLGLDDEKGTFAWGAAYGIAGGALVELLMGGKLAVVDGKVHATDAAPIGDPLLDYVLAMLSNDKKPRSLQYWVGTLAQSATKTRAPLIDSLCAKGLVRREEGKVLWIFDVERYPETDGKAECDIILRIRSAIVDGETPDAQTAALISLAKPCALLSAALSKDELKYGKDRIEQVRNASPMGDEIADTIEACQAAVAAAVMVSTTAATT